MLEIKVLDLSQDLNPNSNLPSRMILCRGKEKSMKNDNEDIEEVHTHLRHLMLEKFMIKIIKDPREGESSLSDVKYKDFIFDKTQI